MRSASDVFHCWNIGDYDLFYLECFVMSCLEDAEYLHSEMYCTVLEYWQFCWMIRILQNICISNVLHFWNNVMYDPPNISILQNICILLQMYCNVLEYWQLWFIPPRIPESPQASVSHSGILYTFPSSITISLPSI